MADAVWLRRIAAVAAVLFTANSSALAGDDGVWSVSKSSGEVWISSAGAEHASLKQEEVLKPGDTIRTGRNGRVLLLRGEETILIAPNSVIGVPSEKKDGMSTTVQQQAGSILLEVEKRNVKHFEVETPYLAAVVKGTQFRVTVNAASTSVEVDRGQVEVTDFRSGQIAQVMPGQAATSFTHGKAGLSLSGTGTFNPIEQGKPRTSSIDRIPVPKGGLTAPRDAAKGRVIHALLHIDSSTGQTAAALLQHDHAAARNGVVRISTSLGEVRLNVQKATHGLAHGSVIPASAGGSRAKESYTTVWSDTKSSSNGASSSNASSSNSGEGSTASAATATSTSATSSVATTLTTVTAAGTSSDSSSGSSSTSSSGATGNGKGNSQSASNSGNSNGNGNRNSNRNDSGNGNGNAFGHSKH
jgi:FecR protein